MVIRRGNLKIIDLFLGRKYKLIYYFWYLFRFINKYLEKRNLFIGE